ncbi:uncharacterized protein LOC133318167 [Gastrolobium bilobum]|uniref:uncharacterized protein LOC133318167 n=1 Tax=Gastrolobium bilobum TaxID=150636 RepID=UPI002AB0A0F9|nr:uncharacterized protein LOC133318167 [Gastrolobium bilobum]
MEGLLPLVYKAIKKNKTRRQYECLSSGTALSYNISMAEIYPQTQGYALQNETPIPTQKVPHHHHDAEKVGHRRYKSVGDFGNGFQSPEIFDSTSSKQLVRIRSQRMFSCITGA